MRTFTMRTLPPALIRLAALHAATAPISLVEYNQAFNSRAAKLYGCSQAPIGVSLLPGYGCVLPSGEGCTWSCGASADSAFQAAVTSAWDGIADAGPAHCKVREPQFCAAFVIKIVGTASVAVRTSLETQLGLPLGRAVGSKFYMMFGDKSEAIAAKNLAAVDSVIAVPAALKVSELLHASIAAGNHTRVLIGITPGFSSSGNYPDANGQTVSGGGLGATQALAQFWDDALQANGYAEAGLSASGKDTVVLDLRSSTQTMQGGVDIVAAQPEAMWLEPEQVFVTSNLNGRAVTQSGSLNGAGPGAEVFYDSGITGEGQVIGCADSGIDRSHCMFSGDSGEPATVTPPFADVNSPTNDWTTGMNADHRKIISYYAHADSDPNGAPNNPAAPMDHGTHVAGTAAGHVEDGTQHGQAFEAKLTFFDIGTPNGALDVPRDMENSILKHGYDTGARIHTNSWGSNTPTYSLCLN